MKRSVIAAMPFSDRLRALRAAAGFTQEGLARAAGVSTSAISKIEQKGIDPSWTTVVRLAQALGVNTSAFEDPLPEANGDMPKRTGDEPALQDRRRAKGV